MPALPAEKAKTMHYKTIVLELIQDRPSLYEQLRTSKRLLPSMECYAIDLRDNHLAWQATLLMQRPGSDPSLIASEAMERAIAELTQRLPSASALQEAS